MNGYRPIDSPFPNVRPCRSQRAGAIRIRQESPARGPSLAVGPGGEVHLGWTLGEDPAADIHYTVSENRGRTFEVSRKIVESAGYSDAPKIVVDGRGTAHVVYAESPAGPLEGYHVRYTRFEKENGTWRKPKGISGAHTNQYRSLGFPYLDLDGQGNLVVVWEIFPDEELRPRGLGFTFSNDHGENFASPVLVPGSLDPEIGFNGSQQGLFMKKLAVSQTGETAIVNSTFKPDGLSRIRLIRGRVAAAP